MMLACVHARLIARSMCVLALALVGATPLHAGFTPFTIGGSTQPSSIQAKVDEFRAALGGANNGNSGSVVGGRREINWDGGGATTATVTTGALTSFRDTRGATFDIGGALEPTFLQTPLDAPELAALHANHATTFTPFSGLRIFTQTNFFQTDVTFSVPGSNGATPATVSGFGVVVSDVDSATATNIHFFNAANESMFVLTAPPGTSSNATLSFVGAVANNGERIAMVRITTGTVGPIVADGGFGNADIVVMDDVIYSEPVAVPEPSGIVMASAFAVLCLRRRRSRD
jgi:hypothetical protein